MTTTVLDIVQGSGTINLSSGGAHTLREYMPQTPELRASQVDITGYDGSQVTAMSHADVTESALVLFKGTTVEVARQAIRDTEAVLQRAARHTTHRQGSTVYLHADLNNSGTVYRSELLYGRVDVIPPTVEPAFNNLAIEARITWTRKGYWEATTEGTLVSGGTVYTHDDASHNNYIDIAGTTITGAVPSPIKLSMMAAGSITHVWVAQNTWVSPTSLPIFVEGEDAGTADYADASSSGGTIERAALTASEATLMSWNVLGVASYGGLYYRMMARFGADPPASTQVRVRIAKNGVTLWEQPELITLTTARMQEIATFQFPPVLVGVASVGALDIELRGKGSGNLDVDFIELMPTEAFRRLSPITGAYTDANQYIVDDGIAGAVYRQAEEFEVQSAVPDYVGWGVRPQVWPGQSTRLHFLFTDGGTASANNTLVVTATYRPRRLTL